jgi:hypothetical protein
MEKVNMSKKQDISASDFKNIHVPDFNINEEISNRVAPEAETRKKFLTRAREMGCEREMLMLFARADKSMRNCRNEQERKDMAKYFCVEVYNLLGGNGGLVIGGQLVIEK